MDAKTLETLLNSAPQILSAIFSGAATIAASFAYKKGKSNGDKAEEVNQKVDSITKATDDLSQKADNIDQKTDKLHELNGSIQLANDKIAELNAFDVKRTNEQLEAQSADLITIKLDMRDVKETLKLVRKRQHDIANFVNRDKRLFELEKIEEKKDGD